MDATVILGPDIVFDNNALHVFKYIVYTILSPTVMTCPSVSLNTLCPIRPGCSLSNWFDNI